MFRGRRYRKGTKILKPVRANAGIEAAYRRELDNMIREMHEEMKQVVLATYEYHEPEVARDASPADALRAAVQRMARRWQAPRGVVAKPSPMPFILRGS